MAAINKKLIHFAKLTDFQTRLAAGDIQTYSIVWIQDAKMIWTHGTYYDCSTTDLSEYSTSEEIAATYATITSMDTALAKKQDTISDLDAIRSGAELAVVMAYSRDLSMMDIHGASVENRTTANCYVVKEAGWYKFPLVYGNAITNGTTNSAAYTKVDGDYSHDFVNYNDIAITSPYIEVDTGNLATSVELTMADTDGVFKDLQIIEGFPCRFLALQVADIPETGANGVVSVLDADGVAMWSWHIWVWPDDLTPVTITNATSVDYSILPVNLGSKKSTTEGKFLNWYYQRGRPTPILTSNGYSSIGDAKNYGVRTYTKAPTASSYGAGIRNPQTFYCNSDSPYNWFGSLSYYNLWDANCTSTGNSDNTVVKTVYDPCPAGFKMPNGNTFSYFSISNVVGSFSNGWYFKRNSEDTTGVFFPASGRRQISDGTLSNVGSRIITALSSAESQGYGYVLYSTSSDVKPQDYHGWGDAISVRPVQE